MLVRVESGRVGLGWAELGHTFVCCKLWKQRQSLPVGSAAGAELDGTVALSMECCWCVDESKQLAVSVCHTLHNAIDHALLVRPTMMQAMLPNNC